FQQPLPASLSSPPLFPFLSLFSFLHPGLFPLRAFACFLRFSSRMMLLIAASAVGSAWLRRQVRVGEKGSSRLSTQRNSNRSWPGFFPFTETAAAFSFFFVSIHPFSSFHCTAGMAATCQPIPSRAVARS